MERNGEVWSRALTIRSEHVNMDRRLRTSSMFRLLQEASIAHTTALGMGRDRTLDRGDLWVIGRQYAEISRMPVYDEEILVRTRPAEMMHVFFPRFYEIVSAKDGETLVRAEALWMLLDERTRGFVFPAGAGVEIHGPKEEPPHVMSGRLRVPEGAEAAAEADYLPRVSQIDINGHVGNTYYFDLLDDLLGTCAAPREIAAEYLSEVRPGMKLRLRLSRTPGGTVFFEGLTADGGKPCFRIREQLDIQR